MEVKLPLFFAKNYLKNSSTSDWLRDEYTRLSQVLSSLQNVRSVMLSNWLALGGALWFIFQVAAF